MYVNFMTLIINLEFNCINNHHQCFGSMVKQMGEYQSMDALYKIYFEMFRPSSK